jgi:hypothetical protein
MFNKSDDADCEAKKTELPHTNAWGDRSPPTIPSGFITVAVQRSCSAAAINFCIRTKILILSAATRLLACVKDQVRQ